MNYTATKNEYIISDDKTKIDIDYVHSFLTKSYWSPGVSIDVVKRALKGSICFGVYTGTKQIGYARVITDQATFAWIADVFINENYRHKGLAKWLIETMLAHPALQGLRRILLATKDAHKLYEQCGFIALSNPERFMINTPASV